MSLAYQPEEGNYPMLINVTHNPDKSVTLTLPDDDGLVRSVTGPLSAIKDYTWKAMCRFDGISPANKFCVFTSSNPWSETYNELMGLLIEERNNATHQTK